MPVQRILNDGTIIFSDGNIQPDDGIYTQSGGAPGFTGIGTNNITFDNQTNGGFINENIIESLGGDTRITNPNDTAIIRGCKNRNALNYNPDATVHDSSLCVFELDEDPIILNTIVHVSFQSDPTNAVVIINGVETQTFTPDTLSFDSREFISPKIFTVKVGESTYTEKFRISSERPTKLNIKSEEDIIISKHFIKLESLIDGKWVNQRIITDRGSIVNIGLQFTTPVIIIEDDEEDIIYEVEIVGDVSSNNIIKYITSDNQPAFVEDDSINIIQIDPNNPWIEFQNFGISRFTHNISYDVYNPDKTIPTTLTSDFRKTLTPGRTRIVIVVNKIIISPDPSSPWIDVENDNLEYNIASNTSLDIRYTTTNTDSVKFTFGTTERVLDPQGLIRLNSSEFFNGIGQYTVYLQPISSAAGSGALKKVHINVIDKSYLPGPDITKINYPFNIKGADFKGFNETFKISWQSINTNYIEIYAGKYDSEYFIAKAADIGAYILNVDEVLKKSKKTYNENTKNISFDLILIPFNAEGDELTSGKVEKITIVFDKGDLKLKRAQVLFDIKSAFKNEFNSSIFEPETSRFLTHYAHLGDGNNKLISTWDIDKETFSVYDENEETSELTKIKEVKSLVLKLYEPLPNKIQPNQQLWISKIQSIPVIEQITLIDEEVNLCISLTPNFNLDLGDDIGFQILDDLVASGSVSSTELLEQYVNTNEFSLSKLNINYLSGSEYNWESFVNYSSAKERAENFYYKVKLIEFHENTLISLHSSSLATGSISVLNEIKRTDEKILNAKRGFDSFENLLYTKSGSLSYPGAEQNALSSSTHIDTQMWYTTIINSGELYDESNKNLLVNNIPQHIADDDNGQDFTLFFHMIGQHFDVLSSYIKGVAESKKLSHNKDEGITNELIYHMLESLGWDADMGVQSQVLWEYAFGKNKDGSSASAMTGKERQQEIWRRLLNNLPYLFKHKGTKRALHAAMACYGIPSSMLTILEFGGPKAPDASGTTQFTFDDRTAAIKLDQVASILIPWKTYSQTGEFPESVELRINTENKLDQTLIKAEGWELKLLAGTGSHAQIEFRISGSAGVVSSGSTTSFPVFNDEYTQIVLNRTTVDEDYVFTIYGKEGFNERIRNEGVGTVTLPTASAAWHWGTTIELGGGLSGSIDEFRLWSTALNESRIENHTLLPDAIDGNHVSSSTEDLIFRLDFEYPKDRSTGGDVEIKNVSINKFYDATYATASNFTSITEYPYQYISYERTVTANVPATGIGFSNKIRFESQTLDTYLSFGEISNLSSIETTNDSNKLGLFFSPTREINMDILRSIGTFNIDNYIGNPSDEYNDGYSALDSLRNYYFDRYNLNIYEYIQLIRYIDQTLFTTLESLVPVRAKVATGLLIEPHLLERNKVKRTKPTAEELSHETVITVSDVTKQSATYDVHTSTLDTQKDISFNVENPQYDGLIDTSTDFPLTATTPFYDGLIEVPEENIILTGEYINYEMNVDAKIKGTVTGEYIGTSFEQYGMDPDSITIAGFGIWATNGHTIRTYINKDGNYIQDRKKVYRVKESNTVLVPENINSNDSSLGTHFVSQTFFTNKVTFLDFDQTAPSVVGNIVEVEALEGYFPSHYRNVGDLTSGLENSFFNGSKQTSATTLDGGPAVETFLTNPNTLKVSDTGRGSGEPILNVD